MVGDIRGQTESAGSNYPADQRRFCQARRVDSGKRGSALNEAYAAYRRDLIEAKIAVRREFGAKAPELLSDAELCALKQELDAMVDCDVYRAATQGAAARRVLPLSERGMTFKATEFYALIDREIRKLKLLRDVGADSKREGSVVLNINNSTVTGLNLGSVVGDMNGSLTILGEQGHGEIVEALKRLSEAIAADQQLGAQRRELLENLSTLSDQGKVPVEQRRIGVVKAAYRYLGETVAIAGHAAAIWATWGPAIGKFFGLPQ